MFNLILLFFDFTLFILSFAFIILDAKNHQENLYKDLKNNKLPKRSSYGLLFSFLALILAIVISLGYY
ncbi:hypothetical protein LCGC14_0457290 [marine sediment metagenome]|uniref:Uncharacterized protein n=1 Tax=marine sediment metagenome TaxID=412755 RepID=A0A0F9SLE7_9ZZZZ